MTTVDNRGSSGSAEAEAQIQAVMSTTNATRQQVIAEITRVQGGFDAIYNKEFIRMRDVLFNTAIQTFEDSHKADFGWLDLCDDCGMKGTFRKYLRIVLYADE